MKISKINRKSFIVLGFFCLIFLVIADQAAKYFIVLNSDLLSEKPVIVIPGFFNIVNVRNTGAAWGMFHGNNFVLLAVACIALVVFVLFFRTVTEWYSERIFAYFMIMGGIIGNLLDRIYRGAVVDFLDFYVNSWHWPAFNVADSCICAGATIIIISAILRSAGTNGTER